MKNFIKKIIGDKNFSSIKLKYLQIMFILNRNRMNRIREAFIQQEKLGIDTIPIFIISFNRLSYIKQMIESLEHKGYSNIFIIDNNSTYVPLLEYYETIPYKVFRLDRNLGHKAFWKSEIFDEYRNRFYVVTDPDVIPIDECPKDFLEVFFKYYKEFPYFRKIGFSLKIDDLPKDGILSAEAIAWEQQFYNYKIDGFPLYFADIDTTFALYAPDYLYKEKDFFRALRVAYPFEARHLPWYKTELDITEEDKYYSSQKTNGWWDFARKEITY